MTVSLVPVLYKGGARGGETGEYRYEDLRLPIRVPVVPTWTFTERDELPALGSQTFVFDEYKYQGERGPNGEYVIRYVRPDLERKNEELKRELSIVAEQLEQRQRELDEEREKASFSEEYVMELLERISGLQDAVQILAAEIGR